MQQSQRPTVAIVGAGFGGPYAARELANQPVDVLLNRHNFHPLRPFSTRSPRPA